MKKLSVVIPCYNEEKNILLILNKFKATLSDENVEVILVNNGSTDNSQKILESSLPKFPFARTVMVEINQGYGYGILQGLRAADGEFVGWTHADMQTDPSDIIKAYHLLEKGDWNHQLFVKGNRKRRPIFDQFFTSGMSWFESVYMGKKLYDVNAQPNLFSKDFFDSWKNPPYDFALDLYALYMARKREMIIQRFDVLFPERIHGESSWNTGLAAKWKFIKRTIEFSVKLKKSGIE